MKRKLIQTDIKTNKSVPQFCKIRTKKPKIRWDGKPIYSISEVKYIKKLPKSSKYLDEPIYHKVKEGEIVKNPLVNTDDSNPDFLLSLADRLKDNVIPFPEIIRKKTYENIYGIFINNKTPRMFYEDVSDYATIIFKDDSEPETYRVIPKLFFQNFAKRQFLAFDVHDLVQHTLQLSAWPNQFEYVTLAAYLASQSKEKNAKATRLKMLTTFVWFVCFEESLITLDNQLVSFGCLNFLAPSETPFNTINDFRNSPIEVQKLGFKWHYVDALKELYKLETKYSKKLNKELGWLKKLGYEVDEELSKLIKSNLPKPFENLDLNDYLKFKITTPKSPEELFEKGINLIKEEL